MTNFNFKSIFFPLFCISLILMIAACNGGNVSSNADSVQAKTSGLPADTTLSGRIRPKGPQPAWAPDIHPEMLAVIENW